MSTRERLRCAWPVNHSKLLQNQDLRPRARVLRGYNQDSNIGLRFDFELSTLEKIVLSQLLLYSDTRDTT